MPDPLLYLQSLGAAAIVSAACVLAMAARHRPASPARLNSACILSIGLGVAVGKSILSPRLAWPPANGLDRLMTIVLPIALAIELISGFKRVPLAVAWLMRLGMAAAIPLILLHGSIYLDSSQGGWSPGETGTTLAACTTLLAGVWAFLEWLSRRSPTGVSISLALVLAIQTAGLTVMMAGYIKGGAMAVPLAATLAAVTLSARSAAKGLPPAIIGFGVVQLFGVLFIGRFFGRLSTNCSLAILLAPLLCWMTELPFLRHRSSWFVGLLRLALVATSLLAVLIAAKRDFDRDMAPLIGDVRMANGPK